VRSARRQSPAAIRRREKSQRKLPRMAEAATRATGTPPMPSPGAPAPAARGHAAVLPQQFDGWIRAAPLRRGPAGALVHERLPSPGRTARKLVVDAPRWRCWAARSASGRPSTASRDPSTPAPAGCQRDERFVDNLEAQRRPSAAGPRACRQEVRVRVSDAGDERPYQALILCPRHAIVGNRVQHGVEPPVERNAPAPAAVGIGVRVFDDPGELPGVFDQLLARERTGPRCRGPGPWRSPGQLTGGR
jgi:hypothetical protein